MNNLIKNIYNLIVPATQFGIYSYYSRLSVNDVGFVKTKISDSVNAIMIYVYTYRTKVRIDF